MFVDELQYKVQELVDRKKTSSYYTTPDGLAEIGRASCRERV